MVTISPEEKNRYRNLILQGEKANKDDVAIDYDSLNDLFYLGQYYREMNVSMARMMENALDWEHLPFLHSSSFAGINAIAHGRWGWCAKVELPPQGSGQFQVIQLLVDLTKHYWATTILEGFGEGTQIHTQAKRLSDDGEQEYISVSVDFYIPIAEGQERPNDEQKAALLTYFQQQYALLYDEDYSMMFSRQQELQILRTEQNKSFDELGYLAANKFYLGKKSQMELPLVVLVEGKSICVREVETQLIAHQALCPHQLGPLSDASCLQEGMVTCPWHGYRFDPVTGKSLDEKRLSIACDWLVVYNEKTEEYWLER